MITFNQVSRERGGFAMNMVPYSIRQASIAELPDIVDLENEGFTPHGTAESKDVIRSRLAVFPEGFIVLETDRIIVGYASAEKWLNEKDPLLDENPPYNAPTRWPNFLYYLTCYSTPL